MKDYYKVLENLIIKHDLDEYKEKILSTSKQQLLISSTEVDTYEQVGNTRFGGYPDLPEDMKYPKTIVEGEEKYLDFLCQINLKDLSQYDLNLPKEGILYFFSGNVEHMYSSEVVPHANYTNSKIIYSNSKNIKLRDDILNTEFVNYVRHEDSIQGFLVEINLVPTIPYNNSIFCYLNIPDKDLYIIDNNGKKYTDKYQTFYDNYCQTLREFLKEQIYIKRVAEFYINNQITFETDEMYIYDFIDKCSKDFNKTFYPICSFFGDMEIFYFQDRDLIVIASYDNLEYHNYFYSSP